MVKIFILMLSFIKFGVYYYQSAEISSYRNQINLSGISLNEDSQINEPDNQTSKDPTNITTVSTSLSTKGPEKLVALGIHPYIVSVQYLKLDMVTSIHFCSAVIVNKKFLVTAAECKQILDSEPNSSGTAIIAAGITNLLNQSIASLHDVKDFEAHPNFDPETLDYNIAIIKLYKRFIWNNHIKPALIKDKKSMIYHECEVLTWIITKTQQNEQLCFADTMIVDKSYCFGEDNNFHPSRMLCSKSNTKGYSCNKDKGAPMVCGRNKIVVAITSSPNFCGDDESKGYDISTELFYYYDWIMAVTSGKITIFYHLTINMYLTIICNIYLVYF